MYVNDAPGEKAEHGDIITIKVPERVRENDKLYVVVKKTKFQENNALKGNKDKLNVINPSE